MNLVSTSLRLCLAIIIGLPAATPSEFKNSAKVALGDFYNGNVDLPKQLAIFVLD